MTMDYTILIIVYGTSNLPSWPSFKMFCFVTSVLFFNSDLPQENSWPRVSSLLTNYVLQNKIK